MTNIILLSEHSLLICFLPLQIMLNPFHGPASKITNRCANDSVGNHFAPCSQL
jgi:hypothetical protein